MDTPPLITGEFGSVYEIRDYHLLPGGLPATNDGWPARIVHIRPFSGLDERVAVRRAAPIVVGYLPRLALPLAAETIDS